jgi:dUTPase
MGYFKLPRCRHVWEITTTRTDIDERLLVTTQMRNAAVAKGKAIIVLKERLGKHTNEGVIAVNYIGTIDA